jgi:SAM-dependent MidA family methyltransferase
MKSFPQSRPELLACICAEIRARGAMTFARFMELALYHPQYGYYTSSKPRIGKAGDYFTSVSVGALFGKLLAKQFLQFRRALGSPPEFEVVEFGGHRGQLRADVIAAAPDLNYRVIEVGAPLPETIVGCVFSNELLDALPVHRVRAVNGQWREIYVAIADRRTGASSEHLVETFGPLSTPRLAQWLRDAPATAMEGYATEVNLRALDWLDEVARRLRRGFVLTIDYGFERPEFFAPHRRNGTLACYHRHTRNSQPLFGVGEQDITAHVEFTSFMEHGKKIGLVPELFTDQSRYLLQLAQADIAQIVERTAGRFSRERAALHQLMHPALMGQAFKVLIQRRVETGE